MTTKKKLNLDRLVKLQKEFSALYRATSLCSLNDWGVHINKLDDLRDLAPAGSELATEFRGGETKWPYETSFDYAGVKFFAIHNVNMETARAAVAKAKESPNDR